MKRVHQEFAYQARELEGQIEGILGDPPDRKNYERMLTALRAEYARGAGIEDLNMMAFALVDALRFHDPKTVQRAAVSFEHGDPALVFAAVTATGDAAQALEGMIGNWPELTRQALITCYLHLHPKGWTDDAISLDELAAEEEENEEDEDAGEVSDEFAQLFDQDEE